MEEVLFAGRLPQLCGLLSDCLTFHDAHVAPDGGAGGPLRVDWARVAERCGSCERRVALGVADLRRGAAVEQQRDRGGLVRERRDDERGHAARHARGVELGARVEQRRSGARRARARRPH
jgi:hypothetical protein